MSNKLSSKQIIIGIVVVILLLNIIWTVMQNKFTPKLEEVKAAATTEITAIAERLTRLEQGGLPDVADLKEDFANLKVVSEQFKARLAQAVKAEEEQLAYLEAQVEAQRARVEELKKLAGE